MSGLGLDLGLALRSGGRAGGGWTPANLGTSLLGWWDAERSSTITQSGNLVSSWKDIVAGYDAAQASASLQPIYSASGFNGRPVVTFDGADDNLTLTSQPFPTGATGGEMWVLVDQTVAGSDATIRCAFSYGGDTSLVRRGVERIPAAGINRARTTVGDGGTAISVINTVVDFSGRHVVRAITSPTATETDVDGVAGTPGALIPATGASRVRMAALSNTSPSNYWQGGLNTVIVTTLLGAADAAQLTAYLKARGGIP